MKSINGFQGEYRWLSNFWPVVVSFEGIIYPSVEHAYQAAKSDDFDIKAEISKCVTAGDAKRMGKRCKIRPDWDKTKISIMHHLLREKFRNDVLREKLLSTGDIYLEETNTWGDRFWGVYNGEGHNFLGFLLMLVRYEIKLNMK